MTGIAERDAGLREAIALRDQGRAADALVLLKRLQAAYPAFSRLYLEQGHCLVLMRDTPAAIAALTEAVRLNPALPAAWDMLGQLYRLAGATDLAAAASQQLAVLKQLPVEIVVANSLHADGDLAPAEEVMRAYLQKDENNVGALRLLARIRKDQGALDEAEGLLASALRQAPDYHAARLDYVMVQLQRQRHLAAQHEAEHLLRHDPDNRDYLKAYAAACVGLGDHEPVIDIYDRVLAGRPDSPTEVAELRLFRANALKITGRQAEAVADYRAALAARPDYGVAWFSLANLKTYRFSDDDVARMTAADARNNLQDMDRVYLAFALGKALEDRGDYRASWACYERGNAVRKSLGRYRPGVAEACAARIKQVFTADAFAEREGWGAIDAAPVFVLGLPRSGSTLVEQVLASHAQVEGTQELTEIGRYAGEVCGLDADCGLPLDPQAILRLTKDEVRALGERFLRETKTYRRLGRPFFIDKMPNNFWHIGLIQLTLPRATIIDVRRAPMACSFSNLKQLFGTTNHAFTYGIDDIARYYRTYLELMRHWDNVLPNRVLRVHYEDVVEDLDDSVRRMLSHCGLPFEPECLAFHETRRSVRTPSSEQVRRPIGRDGLDHWQNYEPWLIPLHDALGDAHTTYRA